MPNRIIRESICTSDSIDGLSWFEEVLFYRLIVNCDDFGRFDGRAAIIKNRLFPLKESLTLRAVDAALHGLANAGLVTLYMFEGKRFLCLPTWHKYQTQRAKVSKYPAPDKKGNASEIICKQVQADIPVFENRESRIEFEMREAGNVRADAPAPAREAAAPAAAEDLPSVRDPETAVVIADYANRVNPAASPRCLAELEAFARAMGPEVCRRAIDIALDERKATWSYIRAILRDKQAKGVKSLADWEALEVKRAPAPMPDKPGEADQRARDDMVQLREIMARERALMAQEREAGG